MPNWFSKKTCSTCMLVRYLLQVHFFFINQMTPDSIPCVKYTECCLKVWHQRSMGARRYHTVSLSTDLECHSPINNPGQIPSLLHSVTRWVASHLLYSQACREGNMLTLGAGWCMMFIRNYSLMSSWDLLTPPPLSWKHRSSRAGGIAQMLKLHSIASLRAVLPSHEL